MPALRPRRIGVALVGVAVTAVAAGATVAVLDARDVAAEAQRTELAAASTELTREIGQLRTAVAAPTHDAQQTTAALQVLLAETVTGSERDPAAVRADVEARAEAMRSQAERLEAAVEQPLPDRPSALPVTTVDPLFARLAPLEAQVVDVAERLRASADRVETFADGVTALHTAAATYAATVDDLPEGDDPDVHATAWRNELVRLAAYREAVDAAGGIEGLAPLADAHHGLIDALHGLAEEAIAALESGDVDGYNARVAAGIGDDAIGAWQDGLAAGTDAALDSPTATHLDRSRAHALGLVKELDNLRRSSSTPLATG